MINIREMDEKDIGLIVSWLFGTTEDFMHQWGGGRWYTYPVSTEQMTAQFRTRREGTLYFIIQNDRQPVGYFELDFIDREKSECAVCRVLIAAPHRSKGYGAEALKLLVRHAFDVLHMKRVYLSAFDFNIGAIKCYEKAGFREFDRVMRPNGWTAVRMEIYSPEFCRAVKEDCLPHA